MTLGMAWVRDLGRTKELIVISDSRLSGGRFWDAGPKIMLLPRSDAVLSFAGDTSDAYPLMLQIGNAISAYPMSVDRSLDLPEAKGHLIRVVNRVRAAVSSSYRGFVGPHVADAVFMMCGYSWRQKRFRIWTLHYDSNIDRFTFRPSAPWRAQGGGHKEIAYIGDPDVVLEAKSRMTAILTAKGKLGSGAFDMEPLEVLRDMLRSNVFPSIGGAPQIVKIYEHSNVHPFPVYWPDKKSDIQTVLGRPMLEYEKVKSKVIDPDNL
ncbi:MAG: hypothetical protein JWO16_1138 [Sphingomonas bacterium]|nr:hypothetical protein [Sphingomonas bacterium]